jgi:hypothetical protein
MCNQPALSPSALSAWLEGDLNANVGAMVDLLNSGDLAIVSVGDLFTVVLAHEERTPRFGREVVPPTMAPALA